LARRQFIRFFGCVLYALLLSSCSTNNENANTTATTTVSPPVAQELALVSRPPAIDQEMKQRGEQDQARPELRVISPPNHSHINGSTVDVKLDLSGDLKGYRPHKDPATGEGNHIHVILDNQPYEAYYELNQPFELRNVTEGKHTLRVFPSRPWHESYKNAGAFQMVDFTVKGGGDASKPTTTKDGQMMASPTKSPVGKPEASKAAMPNASPTPAREGKAMASSNAGAVDMLKPLLTYSRPKGDYSGADADSIMIDFWLTNASLQGQGDDYRVRYSIDGGTPGFIDMWDPIWLTGWTSGKHTVKLELIDKNGQVVENGGYNSTTREINVVKP
jgi:hypothetical protein